MMQSLLSGPQFSASLLEVIFWITQSVIVYTDSFPITLYCTFAKTLTITIVNLLFIQDVSYKLSLLFTLTTIYYVTSYLVTRLVLQSVLQSVFQTVAMTKFFQLTITVRASTSARDNVILYHSRKIQCHHFIFLLFII